MKNLKKRIQRGETVIGCWLNLGSSTAAEIVGEAGFDWVLIDLEHGVGAEKDVLYQIQALEHTPAAPLVRVESFARQRIHRVLDLGVEGIMCPRINDAAEAQKVVAAMRYPPEGTRGVAKVVRATRFGRDFEEYYRDTKENILGVVQIETPEVLNHLDEIAALEGVDVLFIGPSDLSKSLDIFGQFDHPRFREALEDTVEAARKAGKATGILMSDAGDFEKYHRMGIRMIACGADVGFVAGGARKMVQNLQSNYSELEQKKS